MNSELASHWPLADGIDFLNHGSFGSCPRVVLEFQQTLRQRLEAQPVQMLVRELEGLLDEARVALAEFLGAQADDVVFVPNATHGINTVLRSLRFEAGDELLVTSHEYNASRCALDYAAERHGARVVVANVPFPLETESQIVESILKKVTGRTQLALLDHVTSPTAIILPIARLVRELAARGVDTLVDGAHAPGMVPLDLAEIGSAFYTGNCHKWICAPKTAGFLHVRPDHQERIHPLSISHGFNSLRKDRSRFQLEFAWTGTFDPTAYLAVPVALRFMETVLPTGWNGVMAQNRELALDARDILARALQVQNPCPDEFIGSMASLPLPDADGRPPKTIDPLQDELWTRHNIEVPIIPWPKHPHRLVRVSAQLYNHRGQYERLAAIFSSLIFM